MKFFILGIFIIMTIAAISDANADDPHGYNKESVTNNYYSTEGIASAIAAANCSFDNASNALQLCGAMGFADGNTAQTAGVAKKFKGFLLNGTVSTENGQTRYGVGLTIKVK